MRDVVQPNVLTSVSTKRSAEAIVAEQRATGDLIRERRIIIAIGLHLGIGCHSNRPFLDFELHSCRESEIVITSSGTKRERAFGDVVKPNVLACVASQCSSKRVAESESAAGHLVRERRIAIAVRLQLARVGSNCYCAFGDLQLRRDVGEIIVGAQD